MAFGFQLGHLFERADFAVFLREDAVTGILQHGVGVQRHVRAAPGVLGRGQIVGVGFAGHLEYGDGHFLGQIRAAGEPLGVGPALNHFFGQFVAGFGFLFHVVEGIKYQQGAFQGFGGGGATLGVVQQVDQRGHVVTALHGAEQLGSVDAGHQRGSGFAFGNVGKERGFNVSGLVHARRNAVFQQINEECFFAFRRVFQQQDQFGNLLFVKRFRRHAFGGAFFNMFAIGFKHNNSLVCCFDFFWKSND